MLVLSSFDCHCIFIRDTHAMISLRIASAAYAVHSKSICVHPDHFLAAAFLRPPLFPPFLAGALFFPRDLEAALFLAGAFLAGAALALALLAGAALFLAALFLFFVLVANFTVINMLIGVFKLLRNHH